VGLALYGIVGFLVGVVLAVVSTLATPAGTEPNLLDRLGIWVAVIAPVAYGLFVGFAAAVAAALYNAVAALVGGLKVEVPDLEPRWPQTGDLRQSDAPAAQERQTEGATEE
jgi:hypothetical protein